MKKLFYLPFFIILLLLAGCKKDNFPFPLKEKCDYIQAAIQDGKPDILFSKYYEPGTHKLIKIDVRFDNSASDLTRKRVFHVKYAGKIIYFKDQSSQENAVVLELNDVGRLTRADAKEDLEYIEGPYWHYNFTYKDDRLTEIKSTRGGWGNAFESYAKIEYDNQNKNVSKIIFFSENPPIPDWRTEITYTYDYNKKAKEQYYAAEEGGWITYFWYFLTYLDQFPEIRPGNLLTESFTKDKSYPGSIKRKYSDHQLDADGKLIRYNMYFKYVDNKYPRYIGPINYKIDWDCCSYSNNATNFPDLLLFPESNK